MSLPVPYPPMRAGALVLVLLAASLAGCIGGLQEAGDELDQANTTETAFTGTHVYPGEYSDQDPFSHVLEAGPYDLLPGKALYLESEADGTAIEIGVVRPDVPEGTQVPVIAFASPYLSPLHPQDLHEVRPRLTENFVQHGYAVAFVGVRGTADSGGCSDLMGPLERADLDQAITWLGTQAWSNGNVGMLGVSYDGSTPWEVAAEGNPHLKTIVPISGVNDVYDLMFPNGTAESRGPLLLNALYYLYGFGFDNPSEGRSVMHTAEGILCPEAYEGFAAALHAGATGERDPLGYWAERNSRPGVEENYEGSIFLVHGLQDWNVDPHHAFPWVTQLDRQHDLTVKYLLGQWGHAWPDGDYLDDPQRRLDFAEILLHWFDHELKGDTTVDLGPKVQVQDSTGQWRSSDAWPPVDTTRQTWYLQPGGELSLDPTDETASRPTTPGTSLSPADTTEVTEIRCVTCGVFRTETFEQDTRIAGLPPLHLSVTPQGPTGHLSAFLYAVDGDEMTRLGWTQMDLRFADGDETADPIVPGQTITAKMQLEPLDAVIPAGSHLLLLVTQGQQADHTPLAPPSPVMIEVGGQQSTLVLDTFEVSPDQLFEPPS